jgi:surface protein
MSCGLYFTPTTFEQLQTAVNIYSNPATYDVGLATYGDITQWNTSAITSMAGLFSGKSTFNTDISMWDVSNVTDMTSMFSSAFYNKSLNNWNVSRVTSMADMFNGNSFFNQPLNSWNVSNVTNMSGMFRSCNQFNGDISNWNVGNVTNFNKMFDMQRVSNPTFNRDISNWDVHSCINFEYMFYYCNSFPTSYTSHWNITKGALSFMFGQRDYPIYSDFTPPYPPTVPASITPSPPNTLPPYISPTIPTNYKFYNKSDLQTAVNSYTPSNMLIALQTYGIVNTWDVSSITNMNSLFTQNGSFNYDIFNWNVSNVTDMGSMFQSIKTNVGVKVIFNRSLANWNVSNVENMSWMFASTQTYGALITNTTLTPAGIDIGGWNISNCLNFSYMFYQCTNFTTIVVARLSNWQILPLSDSNTITNNYINNQSLNTTYLRGTSTEVSSPSVNITKMIAGATPAFSSFNIITNSLQLTTGWNSIGFFNNIIITDINSIIQPNSIYNFDNNKFTSPVNINSIISGKGYYIKSKSNNSINYKKTSSAPSNLINIILGLNFIVVPTNFIYVDASNIIISIVPSVTNNMLLANTGYWIKSNTTGTITEG